MTRAKRGRRGRSGWPWRKILGRSVTALVALVLVGGFAAVVSFVVPRMSEPSHVSLDTSYLPLNSELVVQINLARLRRAGDTELHRRVESVPRPVLDELSIPAPDWSSVTDHVCIGIASWDNSETFTELSGADELPSLSTGETETATRFADLGDPPARTSLLNVLGLGTRARVDDLQPIHWTAVVHARDAFTASDTKEGDSQRIGFVTPDAHTLVAGNGISIEDAILLGGELESTWRFEFVDGGHDVVVAFRPTDERKELLRAFVRHRLDAISVLGDEFSSLTENVLEGTVAVAASIDLDGDVVIGLTIETYSDERAERMAPEVTELLQSGRDLAAASAADDWHAYHWAELLGAADVSTNRTSVRIVARQPADRLGSLLDLAGDTTARLLAPN